MLVGEHVGAHMGEDDALAVKARAVFAQGLVVEVVGHLLAEGVRLADEDVGPSGGLDKIVAPRGVPRVDNGPTAGLDPQGTRRRPGLLDRVAGHERSVEWRRHAVLEFDEDGLEAAGHRERAGKHRLHQGLDTLLGSDGPRNPKRSLTSSELTVKDENRNAAEVVAVKVRDDDRADRVRLDAADLQGGQGGRPAVNQELVVRSDKPKAGLNRPSLPKASPEPTNSSSIPGPGRRTRLGQSGLACGGLPKPLRAAVNGAG